MYDTFLQTLESFQLAGVAAPLQETLHLLDIMSQGTVRRTLQALEGKPGLEIEAIIRQRREGMPLEYILGSTTFMGLKFSCTPATLIPRAETELLVQTVLDLIASRQSQTPQLTIVDMGTGCGNIAVALARLTENTLLFASDISPDAAAMAQKHVDEYRLQERVRVMCGDLFAPFHERGFAEAFDFVVCNPPYLPSRSLARLSRQIVDYEPAVALDGGAYGIDIFRRLARESLPYLKAGGTLAFEIGAGQEAFVTRLLRKTGGYEVITPIHDHQGIVRVISARKGRG